MIDRPICHADRIGGNKRAAGDPARFREKLPCAALHGVERPPVKLKDTVGHEAITVRPADVHALALALDEPFDGRCVLDCERHGIGPVFAGQGCLYGALGR